LTTPNGAVAGGTTLTIRGSGFQRHHRGKTATVTFKDINTLTVTTPALPAGTQRLTITNPDGETISGDAASLANQF
jgi:IPT/TIG domain-containing protein